MALMASKPPTCTTLPAALCEKHFSRREPRQRFFNACGVPSGETSSTVPLVAPGPGADHLPQATYDRSDFDDFWTELIVMT